jgi:hypothetical protein
MSEVRMWAVKAPRGWLIDGYVRRTRKECIALVVSGCSAPYDDWQSWYRQGYRCVRVRVIEEIAE